MNIAIQKQGKCVSDRSKKGKCKESSVLPAPWDRGVGRAISLKIIEAFPIVGFPSGLV